MIKLLTKQVEVAEDLRELLATARYTGLGVRGARNCYDKISQSVGGLNLISLPHSVLPGQGFRGARRNTESS